jgi:ABC-type spermidine/putrescine transport system permease subunit II
MNSAIDLRPRALASLWIGVLSGPLAWSISLCSMFWLSREACIEGTARWVVIVGTLCTIVTVAAGIHAAVGLRRFPRNRLTRFMLGLAVNASAIFGLVIALSVAPVLLLTPCPL